MTLLLLLGAALAQDCVPLEERPDPFSAGALSAVIGFGTGHYYAKRPATGFMFTLVETLALGMVVGGYASTPSTEEIYEDPEGAIKKSEGSYRLVVSGWALSAASRSIDSATAVFAARSSREEMRHICENPTSLQPYRPPDVAFAVTLQAMKGVGLPPDSMNPHFADMKDWVAGLLRLGLTPSQIGAKAAAGEGPVKPGGGGAEPQPSETRTPAAPVLPSDVKGLTAEVLRLAGLPANAIEAEGVAAWVAEMLRQGKPPSDIIAAVGAGEGPVQPKTPPAPKP